PAKVHAIVLSDVLGDDLSAIASGCTVPDNTTYQDALDVLNPVWQLVPESVQKHLLAGEQGLIAETPKSDDPIFKNSTMQLCASNAVSLKAMFDKAQTLGYQTEIYSEQLCGIAKEEAEKLCRYTMQLNSHRPTALLAGGETTVNLTGTGKGGRNQEFALAFALAAEKIGLKNWTLLSGGTDGRDGPTDAAGGMVDAQTLQRIRNQGLDPEALLNNNDAYTALQHSNDLLITGATGTNVADLQILLLHPLGDA
ncbi:partial glycerate 2-kinase, partial [Candidatus Brocadiaceae bacterium]